MIQMRLTDEEMSSLRSKPLVLSKHFYEREFHNLRFRELETMLQEGEIEKEGHDKYRASMHFGSKIKFMLFADEGDHLKLITVGETSR